MNSFPYCICCGDDFTEANCFTEAGWKETQISGYCEKCYDAMFSDDEEECAECEESPSEVIFRYEEFATMVEQGVINPLDGDGYFGTETTVTSVSVFHNKKPIEMTHVWWYSK